jgi:type II secretory pathway component GspD/PulD (secretin)/chorismate mutase
MRANKTLAALGAACLSLAFAASVVAQDDLDDLLDIGSAKPAKKAEAKPAEPSKAPAAKPVAAPAPAAKTAPAAKPVAAPAAKPAAVPVSAAKPVAPVAKPAEPAKAPVAKPAEPSLSDLLDAPDSAPKAAAAKPVAAKPAPQAKAVKPAEPPHPEAALISDLMETEKLRRQSLDNQADREMDLGKKALAERDWDTMYKQYYLAWQHLNDRADSAEKRRECTRQMAEAKYQGAKQALRESDREGGLKLAEEAQKLHHPSAAALIEALKAETTQENETDISDIKHVRNDKKYKEERDLIQQRLRLSSQYFAVSDLANALDQCDLVLRADPYNRQAIALRERIQRKRQAIIEKERVAARDGMIADVGIAWRPVYAINSPELKNLDANSTKKGPANFNDERSLEQSIEKRMKEMILPSISFRPPATIIDVVDFFRQASKDFDRPEIPIEQRGFNFVLQLDKPLTSGGDAKGGAAAGGNDAFSAASDSETASGDVPQISNVSASNMSLWEALKLVCKVSGFKFKVQGSVVMVMPKDMTTDELVTRTYSVVESFLERVTEASSSLKNEATGSFGGGDNENAAAGGDGGTEDEWKKYFEEMGVSWPQNSRIKYMKAVGKLRVTNTEDQLAVFEDALNELNVTPSMIEIETRFVEVAQEDLNSLGFEWLLNSDYSFNVGGKLKKALNLKDGMPYDTSKWVLVDGQQQVVGALTEGSTSTDTAAGGHTSFPDNRVTTGTSWNQSFESSSKYTTDNTKNYVWNPGAGWVKPKDLGYTKSGNSYYDANGNRIRTKNMLVNSMDGNTYQTGMRYLSSSGNHVSGDALSQNDKFMRLNAFVGNADLSMILHMLSQRSDTDLLSAPKVVTKSGQEATIKVVTIYRFPQDYDVTIQSTSSSGGSGYFSSGGSSGKILPMVEPQNFEQQEVGVILTVTPDLSPEGLINLALQPKIVSEPEWRDYGMKVPMDAVMGDTSIFTSSPFPLQNLATSQSKSAEDIQWFSVPMEQPFFKERSIDTHVTLYNGATIVMGGLITEERRSMEDKIPFLGDVPFLGRLFRSRSEWSNKRNLLIFVTARLVDPNGRQILHNVSDKEAAAGDVAGVTPAPTAN